MGKLAKLLCLPVLTFMVSCAPQSSNDGPQEPEEEKAYDVLFIGNSFTFYNSLDVLSQKIATNIGINMTCKAITLGSHSLLEDADPNDQLGKVIAADLNSNQHTDIVLQDKSNYPYNHYSEFKEGVTKMNEIIKNTQENANVFLYETWGYVSDNFSDDIPSMENTIRANTKMVAKKQDMTVCYVGEAFTYVYENYPNLNLYYRDNKHPSYLGTYLSALVHVATITGKHVNNVTYQGTYGEVNEYGEVAFVSEATKNILISVAERIVFGVL